MRRSARRRRGSRRPRRSCRWPSSGCRTPRSSPPCRRGRGRCRRRRPRLAPGPAGEGRGDGLRHQCVVVGGRQGGQGREARERHAVIMRHSRSQRHRPVPRGRHGGPMTVTREALEMAPSLVLTPAVVAHRGASGHRPEHTLDAYRTAIRMGADDIELDLVSTRDGVLVARHDLELSATTDVAGRPELAHLRRTVVVDGEEQHGWFVQDLTLRELKTLTARERMPLHPSRQRGVRRCRGGGDPHRGAGDGRRRVGPTRTCRRGDARAQARRPPRRDRPAARRPAAARARPPRPGPPVGARVAHVVRDDDPAPARGTDPAVAGPAPRLPPPAPGRPGGGRRPPHLRRPGLARGPGLGRRVRRRHRAAHLAGAAARPDRCDRRPVERWSATRTAAG